MSRVAFTFYLVATQALLNLACAHPGVAAGAATTPPTPPNGAPQGAGPTGNNGSPPPTGITGGNIAIESTILSYRALSKDATAIADAIGNSVGANNSANNSIVIATPTDFSGLLQWRVMIAQARQLHTNMLTATGQLEKVTIPDFFPLVPETSSTVGGLSLASVGTGISTAQALIQTLASLFAVNQSLVVTPGDLTSVPLTNFLAGKLKGKGFATYVPSV
jgi:hypothetical protein